MQPLITIRPQLVADADGVRAVVEAAFREQPGVADLEAALAARPDSRGFVAVDGDGIVGHVRLTRGWIDAPDRVVHVLVLSPLSVAPERQRQGIGRALVAHAVAEAEASGVPAIFLEGSPAYYGRLGWRPASELGVAAPSSRIPVPAFQSVAFSGWRPEMAGALVYADTFWEHDCVGLRGEMLRRAREGLGGEGKTDAASTSDPDLHAGRP